jgi:hypothetical protein
MKSLFLIAVICTSVLIGGQQLSIVKGASPSHKEKAIVEFKTPIKLMRVILQGEYMFVHDEDKMLAGEDCTYVYKSEAGIPGKLVLSFHCIPVPRQKAANFIVRSSLLLAKPVLYELTEYQFAGSSEGHQVPSSQEAINATVDLVGCCL